jgi:predicted acylesterase/phospholipase RssA
MSSRHAFCYVLTRMSDRRGFLGSLGAAALVPTAAKAAMQPATAQVKPVSHALILSGGGARGAYEAGIVAGLARRGSIADGQMLAPYGLVCGSSIGALNAWFVATGQYQALARIWQTLAAANLIQLKSKYTTLDHPHDFIAVRIRAGLRLLSGMTKDEMGIALSEPILSWMSEHIDPATPVLVPLVWAVTNLTTQSSEYFYRLPPGGTQPPAELLRALHFTLGADAIVREASDDILHRALFASAAIPIVFDPVPLPMVDGSTGLYVDGSIASNATVTIARTVARAIDIVLVDPRGRNERYSDAIDVVMGTYETMQRKILETEMRDVYFESLGKRAATRLGPAVTVEIENGSAALTTFYRDLPASDLAYIRPKLKLPAGFGSFDEQDKLDSTFALGDADSEHGFSPYAWDHFRL